MPRRYLTEFRRKVLDLVESGRSVAEVADLVDVTAQTIYNWRNQDQIDRGIKPGVTSKEAAELTAAKKRIRALETELAVVRRANELLKEQTDPKGGSRSSTSVGSIGPPCDARRGHQGGTRRVSRDLRRPPGPRELTMGRGIVVARCTVELLMQRNGIAGLPGRPRYRKIPNLPTASDLVNRDFARTEPNRLWLTDITEHRTFEGKVYCAVDLDAHSRRVVGWSIDSSQTANLVVNALGMAIENRKAEGVVIHSDRGVPGQFTSWAFTQRAVDSGLVPSMGTIGDCYDNGMMESFWARMQVELLNRRRWRTRLELANAIFEYLEIFHNRQRRHSSLGMLTPIEFERLRPSIPEIHAS